MPLRRSLSSWAFSFCLVHLGLVVEVIACPALITKTQDLQDSKLWLVPLLASEISDSHRLLLRVIEASLHRSQVRATLNCHGLFTVLGSHPIYTKGAALLCPEYLWASSFT